MSCVAHLHECGGSLRGCLDALAVSGCSAATLLLQPHRVYGPDNNTGIALTTAVGVTALVIEGNAA
eukprot:71774-Prymnesium_polylepis.2